jgi:hypothetical protein
MNRPIFKKVSFLTLVWAVLVILCGVVALAQQTATAPPAAAEVRTDGQIEMDVVHALDSSQALKSELITAATIQGEVTLTGTVTSDSNRKLAEKVAGQVAGVTKVNNNLKIVSAQAAEDTGNDADEDTGQGQPAPNQAGAPYQGAGQPVTQDDQMRAQIRAEVQAQMQAQRQAQQQAQRPARPAYNPPTGPVTIANGTLLKLRTSEPVNSKSAKDGQPVQFMVIQDVAVGGVLAIPRGATVHGVVTDAKKAGVISGSSELSLTLTSLEMGGKTYPLTTDQFKVKGPNKTRRTIGSALGGAMLGSMMGAGADWGARGEGAGIGAGAGAAAGTIASATSPSANVWIPDEARVDFHLTAPLTVDPVSPQEAARLAQGLYQGGPNLYRRGPYGQPYPYAYGYPPVYYRPYYTVGGYYYWR